jgi:hypothetical protein
MGVEGTGHHTMGAIIKDSPATEHLKDLGIHPGLTRELGLSLFNNDDFSGLWNAHCKKASFESSFSSVKKNSYNQTGKRPVNDQLNRPPHHRRRLVETLEASGPNVAVYLDNVVRNLKKINQIAQTKDSPDVVTTMAINTWQQKTLQGFNRVGQVSYPNFKGDCRKLNFPNLDLWYQACDLAKVDCEHVYIYRDPYAVLRSTNRRGMHPTMLGAIHLYISHLSIIFAQLSTHSQRAAGCWGVLEADATWEEVWTPLHRMFGWTEQQDFKKFLKETYVPPTHVTEEEKKQLAPSKFEPYVQSFYRAHNDAVALCREQVAANRNR